ESIPPVTAPTVRAAWPRSRQLLRLASAGLLRVSEASARNANRAPRQSACRVTAARDDLRPHRSAPTEAPALVALLRPRRIVGVCPRRRESRHGKAEPPH